MMSTQWNTTKTDYDGDSINNNDSRNGKSSLSMPDALREEFRNLCTARTRNIKFVLKALEKKTATVTKEKKVDEVEGKKKKSIHEAATVTKRRRSSSVSGEESGEEESTSHSMSSDGEEDEESNSGLRYY